MTPGEEEQEAECLAPNRFHSYLALSSLPLLPFLLLFETASGKSNALVQCFWLQQSSYSIEFGPWILITLHCDGNESQWNCSDFISF